MNRPAVFRYLTAGKAIGAKSHSGFAQTFNWLVDWVRHVKGGKGVSIREGDGSHPVIDVNIEGDAGVAVRNEQTADGNGTKYVVSLADTAVDAGGGGTSLDGVPTSKYSFEDIVKGTVTNACEVLARVDGELQFVSLSQIKYVTEVDVVPSSSNVTITFTFSDGTTKEAVLPVGTIAPSGSSSGNAVTGMKFFWDAENGNRLKATLQKENGTDGAVSLPLWKQNVVSQSEYSENSHEFTNNAVPSVRTVAEYAASGTNATTVFTATPHSAEHSE